MKERCGWAKDKDEKYTAYHDHEWGVPVYDDQKLFEFIVLESAQAGLSWQTILNKRSGYSKAFKKFDPIKVAKISEQEIAEILLDPGIVRNRLKVNATISNAIAFIAVQKEQGSFSNYLWNWVNNKPIINRPNSQTEVTASSELATRISKDLKKRGFKFLGPTTLYAFMQAVGMVNDHTKNCFRYLELTKK